MCTKNYKNPSIFVKVTAKKLVAPFFWTRCIYGLVSNKVTIKCFVGTGMVLTSSR